MATINVGPLTRIEGHLDIEVTVEDGVVTEAKSSGTMFRGFEIILQGRDPCDAPHLTQRICGVCPVSHGMAAVKNLDAAFGVTPTDNGRIMRNLVLGANFIQSHILHFYHLAALDYIDASEVPEKPPWLPAYSTPDMVTGPPAKALVAHYVAALAIRRKAHQMGAIFGGKLPCAPTFVPGGSAGENPEEKVGAFRALLTEIRTFIDKTYIPDVLLVAGLSNFEDYWTIGSGCGNLLAYGVFEGGDNNGSLLLKRGRYTENASGEVNPTEIAEYVNYSKYTDAGPLNPADGVTQPQVDKPGAYSWLKAPRYDNKVYEVGPLARMKVNGDYTNGTSVLDRHKARALETKKIAEAMDGWLDQLVAGGPTQAEFSVPSAAEGIGLTEAPRGALGHWITISDSRIERYQVVTPTAWNASPKDGLGQSGPIEQALVGTPVADETQPVELLRVVHSFDPCLACSVHMIRPNGETRRFVVNA